MPFILNYNTFYILHEIYQVGRYSISISVLYCVEHTHTIGRFKASGYYEQLSKQCPPES